MVESKTPTNVYFKDRLYDAVTKKILGAAIEVHRVLGPGLLESSYETCLIFELQQAGLKVQQQKVLPIVYKGIKLDCGYKLDLLVEEQVIIEIKAVPELVNIHEAQLITYLKLSGYRIGLLINFNVKILKHGIRRIIV